MPEELTAEFLDRDATISETREEFELSVGARFLWPDTLGGPGYPCSAVPLTNAQRLNDQGGGVSLFDDCIVTVRHSLFLQPDTTYRIPAEQQYCKFKPSPRQAWRAMKISAVTFPPGAAVVQFSLNSASEGA